MSPTHDSYDSAEPYRERAEMSPEEDMPRGEVQEPVELLFSLHYVEWGDSEEIDDDVLRFHLYMCQFQKLTARMSEVDFTRTTTWLRERFTSDLLARGPGRRAGAFWPQMQRPTCT